MNNSFIESLEELFEKNGISYNEDSLFKLNIYKDFLIEYNQKVNLTAIKEPEQIAVKHFLDSAMILKYFAIEKGAKIIDIGTGAGFPGVVLKILRDDLDITLLDSLNKRTIFLQKLCDKLDIKANIQNQRAEECRKNGLASSYDVVVSRAVAGLNILLELSLPYLKPGGFFIAMKGADYKDELSVCDNCLNVLKSKVEEVKEFKLEDDYTRALIKIRNIGKISEKYPRIYAKIKKRPL
ncbi:MAG: 16S rRNA (guanine(527)-N(7))-methyltransferase RsmG [Clostridia bacterium]|nr:16S rRNA (guanine(527)-N(7))-methyltransferase RsmG [Clostridia bacterium]